MISDVPLVKGMNKISIKFQLYNDLYVLNTLQRRIDLNKL